MDKLDQVKYNFKTLETSVLNEENQSIFNPIKYPREVLKEIFELSKDKQKERIEEIKMSTDRIKKFFDDYIQSTDFKEMIPSAISANLSIVKDLNDLGSAL